MGYWHPFDVNRLGESTLSKKTMRSSSEELDAQLQLLVQNGFVQHTDALQRYFRKHSEFRSAVAGFHMGPPESDQEVLELFGVRSIYYYFLREKQANFEQFLEKLFKITNPSPRQRITTVFTHNLHSRGLHWSLCDDSLGKPSREKLVYCLKCGSRDHNAYNCPDKLKVT